MSHVPELDAKFDQLEAAVRAFRARWEQHADFVAAGGHYFVEDPVGVPRGFGPPEDGSEVNPYQFADRVRHPDHKVFVQAELRDVDLELTALLNYVETFAGRVPETPAGA